MERDSQYTITVPDQSEAPALTLISFASDKVCEEFAQVLGKLGYPHSQVSGNDWFSLPPARNNGIRVLFMSCDNSDLEKISAVLMDSKSVPTLAVFDCKLSSWDSRIIQHAGEFLGWPCHRNELALRLTRLQYRLKSKPVDLDEAEIIEEFVGLNMVGRSPAFLNTLNLIKKIARCDAPVCIEGETGTGKELAARAIHYLGARRDQPFIPINCGAIPDNLVESEFFGHMRGAFTDAKETYPGVVEQAHGGSLFLDEVEALSEKAQITLLRFLQDQEYRPLGSKQIKKADVRIIAATNSDILQLVEQGCFRQDLMFRLNIMSVNIPPLRVRGGDIELLAENFIGQYNAQYGQPLKKLHPDLITWMNHYSWPGNVRELENFILREYMLEEGEVIVGHMINMDKKDRRKNFMDRRKLFPFDGGLSQAKSCLINEFEKKYLCWLMKETNGNVTKAAKQAGKERRALGKLLKKYGLQRSDFSQETL